MKIIKYSIIILGILIVAGALVFGYLGLLPGVAAIFGSDKPRDLGVTYAEKDFTSANEKSGVTLQSLPSSKTGEKSIEYTGSHPLAATFTQEEITAAINGQEWIYYPVKDAQMKFNDDGTIELSAILLKDRLGAYAKATGGNSVDTSSATKFIAGNPPIYIKGKAEVVNDRFTIFDIQKAEVGRLDVTTYATKYRTDVVSFIEDRVAFVPGLEVKSAKIVDGKFSFDGSLYNAKSTVNE